MALLDNMLLTDAPLPPMRDIDGLPVHIVIREPAGLHELTADSANDDDDDHQETSRLPAPPQHMLVAHDHCSLALLIEEHVEFYREIKSKDGEPRRVAVALPTVFLEFFTKYRASRLPRVNAIMTLPLVLPNGEILATNGLDRKRRVAMCIDPTLVQLLPQAPIRESEIREAMDFLINEWLVDVAADYAGKCTLIALAMSCLERLILVERPAFFVTRAEGRYGLAFADRAARRRSARS